MHGLAVQPQQPQRKHIKIEMTESASSDSTTAIAAIDPRATEKNVKLIKRSPVLTKIAVSGGLIQNLAKRTGGGVGSSGLG